MSIRNYLQLVNDSMAECKVSLDALTSANFDEPPRTGLYNSFKRWANKAYRDLMLERPEWFFRMERATVELYPRLHVSGLTYLPSVGDVLVGATSGVRFTVMGVHDFEDNEQDVIVERTLSVMFEDTSYSGGLDLLEDINRELPTPAAPIGFFKAIGRYNFADDVVGLGELDLDSVRMHAGDAGLSYPLKTINWDSWGKALDYSPYSSVINYITQAPDGNYEIYPQPREAFVLQFDFSRSYNDMVLFSDTPVGVPEKYQDILLWKAVVEFADFDNNARLFSRATKNIEKYTYYLNRDTLPTPSFGTSRFYL